MMTPDVFTLYDVIEHTWPAFVAEDTGAWIIREGRSGGQRVSAATAGADMTIDAIPDAEARMRALGQVPLFMLRQGDEVLDRALNERGYEIVDPVNIYACPVDMLTGIEPPRITSFNIWEPMAIQIHIWQQGGIGLGRIAVMERVCGPKTALFGCEDSRPAATGFAAVHNHVAMVHALEVLPRHRRRGMGRYLMAEAAQWAKMQGAMHMSVICTQANEAACALYSSLGMRLVGQYHYRRSEYDAEVC